MDYVTYLLPTLAPLVTALVILGKVLKQSKVPDKFIPIILTVAGIIGAFGILAATGTVDIATVIIQGVIAAGCAVYGNQMVKQLTKGGGNDG